MGKGREVCLCVVKGGRCDCVWGRRGVSVSREGKGCFNECKRGVRNIQK